MKEFIDQAGQILSLLLDIPINMFYAFLSHPGWIVEIVIVVSLYAFNKWWHRKPITIFHTLIKMFPSLANSEMLLAAEKEAFGDFKKLLLEGARVDILSQSRIAQLKKIRSDLDYIQKELNGGRYKKNQGFFRNFHNADYMWRRFFQFSAKAPPPVVSTATLVPRESNQDLRQIWEFTLQKAAAHIAEDYRFDDLADKVAKMREQIEKLKPPEET